MGQITFDGEDIEILEIYDEEEPESSALPENVIPISNDIEFNEDIPLIDLPDENWNTDIDDSDVVSLMDAKDEIIAKLDEIATDIGIIMESDQDVYDKMTEEIDDIWTSVMSMVNITKEALEKEQEKVDNLEFRCASLVSVMS